MLLRLYATTVELDGDRALAEDLVAVLGYSLAWRGHEVHRTYEIQAWSEVVIPAVTDRDEDGLRIVVTPAVIEYHAAAEGCHVAPPPAALVRVEYEGLLTVVYTSRDQLPGPLGPWPAADAVIAAWPAVVVERDRREAAELTALLEGP